MESQIQNSFSPSCQAIIFHLKEKSVQKLNLIPTRFPSQITSLNSTITIMYQKCVCVVGSYKVYSKLEMTTDKSWCKE